MKLLRYGPAGQEKPGLLDADGHIRDLSSQIADVDGQALAPEMLARLSELDPRGTVNLMECGRHDPRDKAGDTDGYALAATPVTAAQVWKAWVRAARY